VSEKACNMSPGEQQLLCQLETSQLRERLKGRGIRRFGAYQRNYAEDRQAPLSATVPLTLAQLEHL
jgi:hypothetical protein